MRYALKHPLKGLTGFMFCRLGIAISIDPCTYIFFWGLSQVVPRTDGSTFSPEKDNVSQSFSNSCLWLRHFCLPHGSMMLIKIKGKMLHESFRPKRIGGGELIK